MFNELVGIWAMLVSLKDHSTSHLLMLDYERMCALTWMVVSFSGYALCSNSRIPNIILILNTLFILLILSMTLLSVFLLIVYLSTYGYI